jgi:hypothetical protein
MSAVIGERRMSYGLLAARCGLLTLALVICLAGPAFAQSETPADSSKSDLASGDFFIGASVFLFERGTMAAFAPEDATADELDRGAIYFAVANSQGESGSLALDTIHGWLIAWAGGDGDPPGFDAARRLRLACLIVGADPKAAADVADAVGLGEEARLKCATEYDETAARWSKLVDPYRRAPDRQPPKNSGPLTLDYAPAVEPANDFIAQAMQKNQLFDALTDEVNNALAMPRKTLALLTECKKPRTFYNPDRHEIVICYELLGGILAAAGK